MTYLSPQGDQIEFIVAPGYTPPAGDAVDFVIVTYGGDFVEPEGVIINASGFNEEHAVGDFVESAVDSYTSSLTYIEFYGDVVIPRDRYSASVSIMEASHAVVDFIEPSVSFGASVGTSATVSFTEPSVSILAFSGGLAGVTESHDIINATLSLGIVATANFVEPQVAVVSYAGSVVSFVEPSCVIEASTTIEMALTGDFRERQVIVNSGVRVENVGFAEYLVRVDQVNATGFVSAAQVNEFTEPGDVVESSLTVEDFIECAYVLTQVDKFTASGYTSLQDTTTGDFVEPSDEIHAYCSIYPDPVYSSILEHSRCVA